MTPWISTVCSKRHKGACAGNMHHHHAQWNDGEYLTDNSSSNKRLLKVKPRNFSYFTLSVLQWFTWTQLLKTKEAMGLIDKCGKPWVSDDSSLSQSPLYHSNKDETCFSLERKVPANCENSVQNWLFWKSREITIYHENIGGSVSCWCSTAMQSSLCLILIIIP